MNANDRLITDVVLGKLIPINCVKVIYNPVKADHMVWDNSIGQYRQPYAGELGVELRQFLSVIREKR